MRRLFIIFVPVILALIVFSVILFLISVYKDKGALNVKSNETAKVYLDGRFIGQTPFCKCKDSNLLESGLHTLRLISEKDKQEFNTTIEISPNALTVVERNFQKELSDASIITLSKILEDETKISVLTYPSDSSIELDGKYIGKAPHLSSIVSGNHSIKVSKDKYKDKVLSVVVAKGYKLEVVVYLGKSQNSNSQKLQQVEILETPTGFLRVRESPFLQGVEVTRVYPGDKFRFLQEKAGWFEIEISKGKTGWVSGQYSKKI